MSRELRVGARQCQCAACLEKARVETVAPVVETPVVETPAPTAATAPKQETVPDPPSLNERIVAAHGRHVAAPAVAAAVAAPATIDPNTVPDAPSLNDRVRAARRGA